MQDALGSFLTESEDRIPGKVMFAQVAGSQSYNLALDDGSSDFDFLGVFVRSTKEILRVHPPRDHVDGHEPVDFQFHEVGKFCKLLLKGNPTIVEMLFTDSRTYQMPRPALGGWWVELRRNREMFLNARTLKQYLGYAQGQWRRLLAGQSLHTTGGEYGTKWAYHIIRLLIDAEDIARGRQPKVWKTGEDHDVLMAIRRGLTSQRTVEMTMNNLIREIESLKPWPIPEGPDEDWVNHWLYTLRMCE